MKPITYIVAPGPKNVVSIKASRLEFPQLMHSSEAEFFENKA
jgi:hypothetical protein